MKKRYVWRVSGVIVLIGICLMLIRCGGGNVTVDKKAKSTAVSLEDIKGQQFCGTVLNDGPRICLQVSYPQGGVADGYAIIDGENEDMVLIEGGDGLLFGYVDNYEGSGLFIFEIRDEETLVWKALFINGSSENLIDEDQSVLLSAK